MRLWRRKMSILQKRNRSGGRKVAISSGEKRREGSFSGEGPLNHVVKERDKFWYRLSSA